MAGCRILIISKTIEANNIIGIILQHTLALRRISDLALTILVIVSLQIDSCSNEQMRSYRPSILKPHTSLI